MEILHKNVLRIMEKFDVPIMRPVGEINFPCEFANMVLRGGNQLTHVGFTLPHNVECILQTYDDPKWDEGNPKYAEAIPYGISTVLIIDEKGCIFLYTHLHGLFHAGSVKAPEVAGTGLWIAMGTLTPEMRCSSNQTWMFVIHDMLSACNESLASFSLETRLMYANMLSDSQHIGFAREQGTAILPFPTVVGAVCSLCKIDCLVSSLVSPIQWSQGVEDIVGIRALTDIDELLVRALLSKYRTTRIFCGNRADFPVRCVALRSDNIVCRWTDAINFFYKRHVITMRFPVADGEKPALQIHDHEGTPIFVDAKFNHYNDYLEMKYPLDGSYTVFKSSESESNTGERRPADVINKHTEAMKMDCIVESEITYRTPTGFFCEPISKAVKPPAIVYRAPVDAMAMCAAVQRIERCALESFANPCTDTPVSASDRFHELYTARSVPENDAFGTTIPLMVHIPCPVDGESYGELRNWVDTTVLRLRPFARRMILGIEKEEVYDRSVCYMELDHFGMGVMRELSEMGCTVFKRKSCDSLAANGTRHFNVLFAKRSGLFVDVNTCSQFEDDSALDQAVSPDEVPSNICPEWFVELERAILDARPGLSTVHNMGRYKNHFLQWFRHRHFETACVIDNFGDNTTHATAARRTVVIGMPSADKDVRVFVGDSTPESLYYDALMHTPYGDETTRVTVLIKNHNRGDHPPIFIAPG